MLELLTRLVVLILILFVFGQVIFFVVIVVRMTWEEAVKPRLIPQAEIDAIAEDWIAKHDDPEEAAYLEHLRAWDRCRGAEQVKWKRIRKAIRRKRKASTCDGSKPSAGGESECQ